MAPFDWQDYMRLAEALTGEEHDEAIVRSAISRAYYAAYWKARLRLEHSGIAVQRNDTHMGTHRYVWLHYTHHYDVHATPLSIIGQRLQRAREWADYERLPRISAKKALATIQDARHLIDEISRLSLDPFRAADRAG